ncbi:FecR domain-containing protein [Chitinophaga niabensis]|uniref:FecR family protein n=1 Tax=Chitinophaga niabensis TaxID=536979 RepID=UPI0031BB0954
MTKEEYIILYEKYLNNECSPEELVLLEQYKDDFSLSETDYKDDQLQAKIYGKLLNSIAEREKVKPLFPWKRYAVAAAMLSAVVVSGFMLLREGNKQPATASLPPATAVKHDIQPGSNKAVLILGDGSVVELNDSIKGKIAQQGVTVISKTTNGQLTYEEMGADANEVIYNTINIPRGGQYSLNLPDGSKVWLNAATSFRFPTQMNGKERIVELDGEAYFEVAKSKQPFLVKVRDMQVEVLGTHFNIMAYKDEANINTTLLEGKVKLSSGTSEVILKPGQQGLYTQAAGFKVRIADTDQVLAWKNGYFNFNDEELASVMRKISRWYNVDIQYSNKNSNLSYMGVISRFKNVSDVLNMLSLTGTVQFKIEDRHITVIN